jgi:hypothetical protein
MNDSESLDQTTRESQADDALRTARVLRMRKDNWGALGEAQRACELNPLSVSAHDLTAEIAKELGNWDTALFHMDQAQQLDPMNAERGAKLEKLRKDAEVYGRSVKEVMQEASEGAVSWLEVFRYVFFRPDPVWYRAGWFRSVTAFAGLVLFLFAIRWALSVGPFFFPLALLHLGMVSWVAYDAYAQGELMLFWGPVVLLTSLFGFGLYLTVRGMNSGIGMKGGGRFFSG